MEVSHPSGVAPGDDSSLLHSLHAGDVFIDLDMYIIELFWI